MHAVAENPLAGSNPLIMRMRPVFLFSLLSFAVLSSRAAGADYFKGFDDLKRNDIAAAIAELTPLADAGEADAQDSLGVAYDHSNDTNGTTRARALFRQAAENGLLLGMLNLALSLQSGRGGPADPATAAEWLTKAAQGGLAPAMVRLADAYRNGIGVPVDKANAQSWYERAAKTGDPAGMAGVADLMLASADPAVQATGTDWLQRASDRGNPHAQQELALAKILGTAGMTKDEKGGVELARSAAAHGNGLAAVILGESYHEGRGVAPSEVEAVPWYAEAARLGAIRGQIETARYKLAPGLGHDPTTAFFWLEVAGLHPGPLQTTIASLEEAAARELTPSQQAQMRARAANWRPGMNP